MSKTKILVCEDNFVDRKILCNFMQQYGTVDVAANGKEAVEAFSAGFADKNPYCLIFLDINMPEMNGHEVLKAIRNLEKEVGAVSSSHAVVIMITSAEDPATILRSFKEQCDGYIKKPVTKEKLKTELAKHKCCKNI
ncbi:MAG: response regulator [Thermodesulfobacteriota bacterium]|nr:response regulator [Thermodesulfobacteriota bacterium]